MKLEKCIAYKGSIYYYEYKLAKNEIDICLATKDPTKYCNGFFLYSDKEEGNGMEFVVIAHDNPSDEWYVNKYTL
jgi:hypothetical protein